MNYLIRSPFKRRIVSLVDTVGKLFFERRNGYCPKTIKSILLIRLDHLGDVLLTTPALKSLKQRFPHARITMVVKGWAFEVIKENPHIDKIIIFNPSWTVPGQEGTQTAGIRGIWELIFRLRREHCDLAIDFKGDPRNILIAYLSGAKRRISYAIRGGGFLLTDIVPYEPGIHEIDKNLKLLTPLGIHSEDSHMELFIHGEDRTMVEQTFAQEGIDLNRKTIALHYGGASRYKRWDMEKFITLAQRLTENNLTNVLMFGGPYEKTSQLGEKSGQSIFTMPGMTICQMAAAFKKCDLLVCNDSGPMHIGLAVGIPTVAIFGPTFADRFGPKDLEKNRVIYSKRPCSPCWHPDKAIGCVKRDCFQSIEVESVLAAVNELSNGTSR